VKKEVWKFVLFIPSIILILFVIEFGIRGCYELVQFSKSDTVNQGDLFWNFDPHDKDFGMIGIVISDKFLKDSFGNNAQALVTYNPANFDAHERYCSVVLNSIVKIKYTNEFYYYLDSLQFKSKPLSSRDRTTRDGLINLWYKQIKKGK